MATDLDKTETGLLLVAVAGLGYFLWKASHAIGDAAASAKAGIGPPAGTTLEEAQTACDGKPCPDDYLARQPWWQNLMRTLGIGQTPTDAPVDNDPASVIGGQVDPFLGAAAGAGAGAYSVDDHEAGQLAELDPLAETEPTV